jgi:hypothetical protein
MILIKPKYYETIAIGVLSIASIFSLIRPSTGADTGGFQKIDPNKVPDELAMLATVTRANYEKIKTWQGKITFEDMIIYRGTYAADLVKRHADITIKEPNEVAQRAEGTTEFKIDLKNNILFKYMSWAKPTEFIDFDKGVIYPSLSVSRWRTKIITGEYEIESLPYTFKKDGTILGRIGRKQLHKPSQIDFDESDPRHCFSIGQPAWVTLSKMSEYVRNYNKDPNGTVGGMSKSDFDSVVLEKDQTAKGITYRMKLTVPGEGYEEITFDGAKGFNPTYIEVKNGKGIKISKITIDFNEIDGIFLPSQRHVLQYDGTDGRLRREAKSTFSDMQVNMVFPENTFSLNNLGLCNGDKFIDKILDKEYTYKDGKLIEETKKPN